MVGHFETHLTAAPTPGHGPDHHAGVAARLGLRYSQIVLDRGAVPTQPMFTGRRSGTLTTQRHASREWAAALRGEGLELLRIKIEADPSNTGVPQDAAAAASTPERYFEHHVKLLLADSELPGLPTLVTPFHAHVSRNARRVRTDGLHERFVTQRCHAVGRATAHDRLTNLLKALAAAGRTVLEVEEEFVVLDDNPA
jgi:hypothetical protein